MSDCYASSPCETKPRIQKQACPACNQMCLAVPNGTVRLHVKATWAHPLNAETYYFCRTQACDVVYFSEKGEAFHKSDIRTRIGVKETDDDSLICFCFGVSRSVAASNKSVKDFVVEQTKASSCSCEITNPSGQCCLKDFPKFNG